MVKLDEPLLVIRHTSKVPNQKVAKSGIVHVVVLVVVVLVLDKKFGLT